MMMMMMMKTCVPADSDFLYKNKYFQIMLLPASSSANCTKSLSTGEGNISNTSANLQIPTAVLMHWKQNYHITYINFFCRSIHLTD